MKKKQRNDSRVSGSGSDHLPDRVPVSDYQNCAHELFRY